MVTKTKDKKDHRRQIDSIISALYLAKSDNRERMLSDLVLNVLYSLNKSLDVEAIFSFIKQTFHLEPIRYELQKCLENLVETSEACIKKSRYSLSENSNLKIHQAIIKEKEESNERYNSFKQIVKDIYDNRVNEEEILTLWEVFKEYLLECFMVFGRKAIDIFLSYKDDKLDENDNIYLMAYKKLNSEKLVKIFRKIVLDYPERISDLELTYLTNLTSRAEKFYSLGIEKGEYEKIEKLQIKDLVVLLDTNILYSILDLRIHPENAAIYELLRIAKEKLVDIRLVFLPKTLTELQKAKKYLEKIIPKENFKAGQIKVLLDSEKLGAFAIQYYKNKLLQRDIPHPGEKIAYASDILKNNGIIIYNHRFPRLEEDKEFFDTKLIEYQDFQEHYNKLYEERGYNKTLTKEGFRVEHDVFLREGVKFLKSKYSGENELRFVCLSLDNNLIRFDQYIQMIENKDLVKDFNPNFLIPSLFIKKIRPFIPIETNDYRKAFISSLTAPSFEVDSKKESVLIQKSMTYFKNLGIDDEEIILNCIKRELFLEEFSKHEENNTADDFIKSQIAKEIESIQAYKAKLEIDVEKKEEEIHTIKAEKEAYKAKLEIDVEKKEEEIHTIKAKKDAEKSQLEQQKKKEVKALQNNVNSKDNSILSLKKRIEELENQNRIASRKNDWLLKKQSFIDDSWNSEIPKLRTSARYACEVIIITFIPIIGVILLKGFGNTFIIFVESHGISQWYIWGGLASIQLCELVGRTYVFDKNKIKIGWRWFWAFFSKNEYNKIMRENKSKYETEFLEDNPKPTN